MGIEMGFGIGFKVGGLECYFVFFILLFWKDIWVVYCFFLGLRCEVVSFLFRRRFS